MDDKNIKDFEYIREKASELPGKIAPSELGKLSVRCKGN